MSRFNQAASSIRPSVTVNHEGAPAYKLSSELELYTIACNSLVQPDYYRKAGDVLNRVTDLVKTVDPVFTANLASYARNEMNLRSIPVVLAVLLCRYHGGSVARNCVSRIVKRVDEIPELLAYFFSINEANHSDQSQKQHKLTKKAKKVPRSLLRGLKEVFESGRFDEYQFAKYDRENEVKLKDALFLAHPKPRDEAQKELYTKIANGTLATPYTWEVELSRLGQETAGQNDQTKKAAKLAKWRELVDSRRLGHMALLRNLNNILKLNPSGEFLEKVCDDLVKGAPNGKQFPFAYWTAYKLLMAQSGASDLLSARVRMHGTNQGEGGVDPFALQKVTGALEEAVKSSIKMYPQFTGKTVIACDVSGSMNSPISPKSVIENFDVGLVLGSLLKFHLKDNAIMGIFGDKWKVYPANPSRILDNVKEFYSRSHEVGWSTNGHLVVEDLVKKKLVVDNVLLFTDCQLWNSSPSSYSSGPELERAWTAYKKIAPNAKLWLFDLAGHGDTPIRLNNKDVTLVSGWSDKVFEAAERLRQGDDAVGLIKTYAQ